VDEFDAVKAMAAKARTENEKLAAARGRSRSEARHGQEGAVVDPAAPRKGVERIPDFKTCELATRNR